VRLLLDTNVLIRAIESSLRPEMIDLLADPENELFVSDVSLWELEIKVGLGKLKTPGDLDAQMAQLGMVSLPLDRAHIAAYRGLPLLHRDPFDRMLVSQAQVENLILVTGDRILADYDIAVMPA
jgi:PIN domain nuclease of toxin-antitoxin system